MSEQLEVFQQQRGRMFGIAYRMLGSATEADEVLQDAWLRWQAVDPASVREPAAFLAKTVTNLCLNQLTSARARRETYVGEWLPEPILTGGRLDDLGPLDEVAQRESVSFALLTVLEKLTPAERAAYVLREAFGYSHREVADLIGTTEANARQLHSRARKRVAENGQSDQGGAGQSDQAGGAAQSRPGGRARQPRHGRQHQVDPAHWRELVERFLAAARLGDVAGLEAILAADVVSRADGGGKVNAARNPVVGRDRVARYLVGVLARFGTGIITYFGHANGEPVLVAIGPEGLQAVIFLGFDGEQLSTLDLALNPDKLSRAADQLSRIGGVSGLGW